MSTFVAFCVGCLTGCVIGVFSLAALVAARDAEDREQRMRKEVHDYEDN